MTIKRYYETTLSCSYIPDLLNLCFREGVQGLRSSGRACDGGDASGSVIQDAELIVVEGENHMITKKLKTVVSQAVSFFASQIH